MSSTDASTGTETQQTRNQLIFAVGSSGDYEALFERINDQFKSNKKYEGSANQLSFKKLEKSDSSVFPSPVYAVSIATKYYDLDLDLAIVGLDDISKLEKDVKFLCSEGVFLLLNKENVDAFKAKKDLLVKVLNDKEGSFMPLITTESNQSKCEVVKDLMANIDELIQIDLTAEDNANDASGEDLLDSFNGFDELINCIFVHPWSDIVLRDEKTTPFIPLGETSIITGNNLLVDAVAGGDENAEKVGEAPKSEEDAFNFEDLLMNLTDYKAQADNLDFEDRKKYAESIVLKFWESIGGDKEEIGDLNDL